MTVLSAHPWPQPICGSWVQTWVQCANMLGSARICATGPAPGWPNPHASVSRGQARDTGGQAGLNGGQAGVSGGQAGVNGGHAGVNGGHAGVNGGHCGVNTWQPGPMIVQRALHVAAGGTVQAGVMQGTNGEWHGPAMVHWTLHVAP